MKQQCYLQNKVQDVFYNDKCKACNGLNTECGRYVSLEVMEQLWNRTRLPRYRKIDCRAKFVRQVERENKEYYKNF